MLERILEPEAMDSDEEARDYDAMDHAEVNRIFVEDLLATGAVQGDVLDLGTGTALIPIELCRWEQSVRVLAVDLAVSMLDLARYNIEVQGLIERIQLAQVDAKKMDYDDELFSVVISNSIIHHIPDPLEVLSEVVRVVQSDGLIFIRDLLRPEYESTLENLVHAYVAEEGEHAQKMFTDSLHAALSIEEIRAMVEELGYDLQTVQQTSDRHWTWSVKKK